MYIDLFLSYSVHLTIFPISAGCQLQHNVNYVAVRGNRRKLHIEEIEGESVL